MLMLVAYDEKRQFIILDATINRDQLRQARKTQRYYCPACHQVLQLKIGTKNTPHFSHYKQSACSHHFSENETMTHIAGKQQLYDFFSQFGTPHLEAYLPQIQQRPDILHGQTAIEFQYSRLTHERFLERNAGYASLNLTPLWLPYSSPREGGLAIVSLSHDLQKYRHNDTLLTYNPSKEQFIYYSALVGITSTQFLAKITVLPKQFQTWPFRTARPLTRDEFELYMQLWYEQRRKLIQHYMRYRRGIQDTLLRFVYERRLALLALPEAIGVPTDFDVELQPAIDWQIIYYYDYFPQGVEEFLAHHDVPKVKVQAYEQFLQQLQKQKASQNELLYSQFIAFKRYN